MRKRSYENFVGRKFGRAIVTRMVHVGVRFLAEYVCECGNVGRTNVSNLENGTTKSCGCYRRGMTNIAGSRHGQSRSPEYAAWRAILQRCLNPKCRSFPSYGGRGISLCDRWLSFDSFLSDIGKRPTPEHSIDRVDNNGNYEPSNCRWATRTEQQNNRRGNRIIRAFGQSKTMTEWARTTGFPVSTLGSRLQRGWPVEQTLKEPASFTPYRYKPRPNLRRQIGAAKDSV